MQDSIFTKIVKGEIPCYKIYEDELTLAFLDIHPAQPGHTLVIPKRQVEFLWDLPDEDYAAVQATAKKVALHLREVTRKACIGVKVKGLDVPHAHIHLIPFDNVDEEYYAVPDMLAEPDHPALAKLAKTLAF